MRKSRTSIDKPEGAGLSALSQSEIAALPAIIDKLEVPRLTHVTERTVACQTPKGSHGHQWRPMHKRDVFHAFMVRDARFEGEFDMPCIRGTQEVPQGLIPFSEAMNPKCHDYHCHVMFYEDDFRFERIWSQPERYAERLKKFAGAVSPDFSTCTDFPGALKVWNTYRDRAVGFWMQHHLGLDVIANVRVEELTRGWALDGLPHGSLIGVGARACVKDVEDRKLFCQGLRIACDELQPSGLVWYGSEAYGVSAYPREYCAL